MAVDIAGVTAWVAGCDRDDVTLFDIQNDGGSPATAGLWQAVVAAGPGTPRGEYFVKLLRHPRSRTRRSVLSPNRSVEVHERVPWRFELDMELSGIGEVLPPGLRTPVLHHHEVFDADHIGLWWEFVHERRGRWSLDELGHAATLLGSLAARRRDGAEVNDRLPDECRSPAGSATRHLVTGRVLHLGVPQLTSDAGWGHPLVREVLDDVGDSGLPGELVRHAPLLLPLLDALDALPQTHAHGDASVQNLLMTRTPGADLVVVDWGPGSLLPVGYDLGQLLVGPMHAGVVAAAQVPTIDAVTFPAYLAGLSGQGYDADLEDVRFGYLGSLFARSLFTALPPRELLEGPRTRALEKLVRQRVLLVRALLELTGGVVRDRVAAP